MHATRGVAALIIATAIAGTQAEQFAFVGARANGMAGANAASTCNATAQWHNPAAFGFFGRGEWASSRADNGKLSEQGFSYEVFGIGAGYSMTENMGRYLDILADIDFNNFGTGQLSTAPQNVDALLAMAGVLGSLSPEDALYADASAGTSIQIGRFGIGVRMFGEATAWTLPDQENLSLSGYVDVAGLVADLDGARINQGGTWDGAYVLSGDQRTALAAALGGIDANGDLIKYLDDRFGALLASGDLDGSELANAVDLFSKLVPNAGLPIESNQTAVVGHAFSLVEIPVTYGWAMNENLSFGVTAKAMYGSVLGTQLWIFDENNDQVMENVSDSVNSSLAFGLDLGALYRISKFQFAMVGHNLNRPTFDGFTDTIALNGSPQQFTVPDVKVDPQVTLGAAFIPTKRITLESNLDLLETGTLLNGYDIQRLSFGSEFDLSLLALRLGAYKNLAESWQDWVATAGIGVDLFGARVDLGGAVSLGNNVDYQGSTIPAEARIYAGVGLAF